MTNQATASATDPTGTTATDLTGTTATDDTGTVTSLINAASMLVLKVADASGLSAPPVPGDSLAYWVTLTNTGNVSLTKVALTDSFSRRDGTGLALTPMLQSGDGGVVGKLEVGEVWTYAASHVLTQADIDAGGVSNSVLAAGDTPQGATITDRSDDGDDTDGNTTSDPTVVNLGGGPSISLVKTLAAGSAAPFTTTRSPARCCARLHRWHRVPRSAVRRIGWPPRPIWMQAV